MMDVAADKKAGTFVEWTVMNSKELSFTHMGPDLCDRLSLPHLQKTMHSLSKQPVKLG